MLRSIPVVLAIALALPALADETKESLLILAFKHEEGTKAAQNARLINDLVAVAAEKTGKHKVITGADIANVIELEAEREALGCDDTSASCLAEVAGAMGAELVLFGNVGQLGDTSIVTLNLFNSAKAQSAGRETVRAQDMNALPDAIEAAVGRLLGVELEPQAPGLPVMTIAAGSMVGIGALVAGGGLLLASGQNDILKSTDTSGQQKSEAFGLGQFFFWTGVAGAATALGGVGLFLLPGGE